MLRARLAVVACLLGTSVAAQDFRPLVVLHAAAAPVDVAYVNAVIGKMNAVIQAVGACSGIRFYRGANPLASADVPATISTSGQTQRLFDTDGGNVLVPRFLSYCGRPDTGFAGCSSRNKNAVVEYQPSTDLAALLWLHEIGHSHKLSHVDDSTRVMYPVVGVHNQAIIDSECAEYLAGNDKFPIFGAAVVDVADLVENQGIATETPDGQVETLKSILASPWAGGTAEATAILDPLSQAMPNFLGVIRQVLLNDDEIELWPNAVLALGIYGEESDIPFLESFLARTHPESDYTIQSLANIPFAIGYLSGKFSSTQGLSILRSGAEMEGVGVERPGMDPELAKAITENFAQESLTALARAQGEIARQAERGAQNGDAAILADEAIASLTDRIARGDAPFPIEQGGEQEFLTMLDELQADVRRVGIDAFVRSPNP
jgi:hypothetical protein